MGIASYTHMKCELVRKLEEAGGPFLTSQSLFLCTDVTATHPTDTYMCARTHQE